MKVKRIETQIETLKKTLKKIKKKWFGIVTAIFCAPLALFVIAHHMSIAYLAPKGRKDCDGSKQKSKPSRIELAFSLAYYLVTLSALNVIVAVIQKTKASCKVARHLRAMYVATAIVAICKMAALKSPSLVRSR